MGNLSAKASPHDHLTCECGSDHFLIRVGYGYVDFECASSVCGKAIRTIFDSDPFKELR